MKSRLEEGEVRGTESEVREAVRAAPGKLRAAQPASLWVLMWETENSEIFVCTARWGKRDGLEREW